MIEINKNYYIDIDDLNVTAKHWEGEYKQVTKKDKKTGETINEDVRVFRVVGYYGSLKQAVEGIFKEMSRKKLSKKNYYLKEAIEELKVIEVELTKELDTIL